MNESLSTSIYSLNLSEMPPSSRMTVQECKAYVNEKMIPNAFFPEIEQDVMGNEEQFNSSRIRKNLIEKPIPSFNKNAFKEKNVLPNKFWYKNKNLDSRSVSNTFNYLFHKFKKGIFIRIANNKLESFIPFENVNFQNEYSHLIEIDPKFGSMENFMKYVSGKLGYRNFQKVKPKEEWVANNPLLRFETVNPKNDSVAAMSANNKVILQDMFETLCEKRNVPDIEFFINRRDFPQIKMNDTEAYNHIWGGSNHPLVSHKYEKYAPILSGSTSEMYADIAFPTYEDWARCINQKYGTVFPNACREYPKIEKIQWNEKIAKAVFRGTTTGAGVTPETNQRIKVMDMAETPQGKKLLNVGITKWNLRPRKLQDAKYIQTIERRNGYPKANRLSLQEQSQYKYILNLEGHVAAYRLSYEMSSGSVILLADSKWKMWYHHLIKPYVHYVPVKEDLSDLFSQIEWCKQNDEKCQAIAKNALNFYSMYLNEDGVLDFLEKELWEISKQTKTYEYLPDLVLWNVENEKTQLNKIVFSEEVFRYDAPKTPRCIGLLDGMLQVFRSKSISELDWKETLFENINGQVDIFNMNGMYIVGKKSSHEGKQLEHDHENYIGLYGVNKLVAKVPNFAYVFGPIKDAQDMVFMEHVPGLSFMDWIKSRYYNFKDFLSILVQINLALNVAQNYNGFIHNDLYPWNIIIKQNNEGREFHYFMNFSSSGERNIVTMKPNFIPVIVDYGKARCIIYEEEYGNVDHGICNLYQQTSISDTLSILYGSLAVLKDEGKLTQNEYKLLEFPQKIGVKNHTNITRWTTFGSFFKFKPSTKSFINPKSFIDFIFMTFKNDKPQMKKSTTFSFEMENGINPVTTKNFVQTGNWFQALMGFVQHVDKSRQPQTSNLFFQKIMKNIIQRRSMWTEYEIRKIGSQLEFQWSKVKKLLEIEKQKVLNSKLPENNFPKPEAVYLDEEITPEYVKNNRGNLYSDDWLTIWQMMLEANLFNVTTIEYSDFIRLNGFLYHNAIASNNTMRKLHDSLG